VVVFVSGEPLLVQHSCPSHLAKPFTPSISILKGGEVWPSPQRLQEVKVLSRGTDPVMASELRKAFPVGGQAVSPGRSAQGTERHQRGHHWGRVGQGLSGLQPLPRLEDRAAGRAHVHLSLGVSA
jgi:hypothetical protein